MIFLLVSFLACVIGAICGIGGGVIIKPALDMLRLGTVAEINFLSGCTVLAMSCYSVGRSLLNRDGGIVLDTGTPLALGAAVGGLLGKQLFSLLQAAVPDPSTATAVQAVCLGLMTLGTLLYTAKKDRIRTHHAKSRLLCLLIGLVLGLLSSFLGIGGGPMNLVVLFFFFSMDTKTAAANSLYIILFSQLASFLTTLATRSVPAFQPAALALMVTGGILGGIVGRKLNKKLDNRAVDKLFMGLMAVIVLICVYNLVRSLL